MNARVIESEESGSYVGGERLLIEENPRHINHRPERFQRDPFRASKIRTSPLTRLRAPFVSSPFVSSRTSKNNQQPRFFKPETHCPNAANREIVTSNLDSSRENPGYRSALVIGAMVFILWEVFLKRDEASIPSATRKKYSVEMIQQDELTRTECLRENFSPRVSL